MVYCYQYTYVTTPCRPARGRTRQTGVRLEKHLLKVLKAFADYNDLTLGDLLEGIVLHSFEGKAPFGAASLARIQELKAVFGLTLDASHAHRLKEEPRRAAKRR